MRKLYFILIVLIIVSADATAQRQWLYGYLRDSSTHFPIVSGTIKNSTSNKSVLTDKMGFFRLEVAPNDLIYALASSYRYDTVVYSLLFSDTITIFLQPSGVVLPTITVTAQDNRYQLDSLERRREFEEKRGNVVPAISGNNNGAFGIGINLDRFFKKKYKNQKRDEQSFNYAEKAAYVDYRFSAHLVAYYTGLKGDALRDFLNRYKPSYEWLRQHPYNEDVFYYINDKMKEFKKP